MNPPKLFISYSWSSPDHQQYVIDLATLICESGVEVILDKWDLKEGHDAYAFMEKMVTDSEIQKVAIISDRIYSEKADERSGGVGTETQIISKEVYDNQKQDKFVAIVTEKDGNGKAFLPTYYKSRIYIDLSEPDTYEENFERLIRWIFDKPLYVKPVIGNPPPYISTDTKVSLGTTACFKRTIDALKNDKPTVLGNLEEYFETFSNNLELFRIKEVEGEFDEAVIENINNFLPYRNEFIQLLITISQYCTDDDEECILKIHRFFESVIHYLDHPQSVQQWQERDFDNFKFIIHELFLYAIAILLRYERFKHVSMLINQNYYKPENSDYGRDVIQTFTIFRNALTSIDRRNQRLNLRRLSLHADLLKERCKNILIDFKYLMQADFILFINADLKITEKYSRWWPITLIYLGHFNSPFEIFARSISKKYFEKIKCIFDILSPNDLDTLLDNYKNNDRLLPMWEARSFNPWILLNYEKLCTEK